jgi:hypothetical protein
MDVVEQVNRVVVILADEHQISDAIAVLVCSFVILTS